MKIYYWNFFKWMKENGVDAFDIADLLEVTSTTVRRKLNRKHTSHDNIMPDFTLDEVRIICEEYGLSAEEYFITVNKYQKTTPKKRWEDFTLGELKNLCEEHIKERKEKEHHDTG